ncbi:MAG TPA: outer membrane beta-barrel protein, partial [Sphingomicrobium sp.]|nr:outer membrane beta-barrel protein [Sphingomicrobium sp.]
MRKYLLAAAAAAALATPATARDKSVYVGVEGGLMLVEDTKLRYEYDGGQGDFDVDEALIIDHKYGFDIDLVAGYDFGLVRTELELGYKRASIDEVMINSVFYPGIPVTEPYDADGSVRVWSVMLNALLDFGDEDNWSGYIGLGAGIADVKYDVEIPITARQDELDATDSDTGFAWQIIAGVRKAITPQLDLGLKYRMFTSSHRDFEVSDNETFDGRFRSHSLLLSLIYN